jgi:beta-galactosidase
MTCQRRKTIAKWGILCLLVAARSILSGPNVAAETVGQGKDKSGPSTAVELRARLNLNKTWKFAAEDVAGGEKIDFDDSKWRIVDLPHTWNAEDTQDDAPGYRLGVGWYRKVLNLDKGLRDKRLFLYFKGANQVADVFVNGSLAGHHEGGYTAFAFDVTDLVRFDSTGSRNIVAVKVDNSINREIPPFPSADFNLYGGIYRDVLLVATDPVHLTMLDHASAGVYVDTPVVSEESAIIRLRGAVTNNSGQTRKIRIRWSMPKVKQSLPQNLPSTSKQARKQAFSR